MKRSETTRTAPGVNPVAQDAKTWERFPNVYDHLGHVFWDDGKARTVSTLTVFFEDGLMKVALNDREAECSLFVTGKGFEECLRSLEKRLSGEQAPDWRPWGKRKK